MNAEDGFVSGVPAGVRTAVPDQLDGTRLVLVRHGESQCSLQGVVGGPRGCTGLSTGGIRQAEALRDRLVASGELRQCTALYSSILPRAAQTAAIMAAGVGGGRLQTVEDCRLCELHPGDADGLTWSEFSAEFGEPDWDKDPDRPIAPGGESWSGFVRRAADGLVELARCHAGEHVVVACHGGVIEAAMLALLPAAPGRRRLRLHTANTSITEWELSRFGWRPLRYNDTAHLRGT
jgi:probable phosphoglycerate mutase